MRRLQESPHCFCFNMKKHLLLFLIISAFSTVYAAESKDRYVMRTFENGQLYFILPFDIPVQSTKSKPLSADITYLTASDSVTMKISVLWNEELSADSIVLVGNGKRICAKDFETYFIEPDGKWWLHRYSMSFLFSELTSVYTSSKPFSLSIYAKQHTVRYGYSDKAWLKEQQWMNKILHIIDSNRRFYR